MIKTGFHIGERDWWLMAYLDIQEVNLGEIHEVLTASGCRNAGEACDVLAEENAGFTFSNLMEHVSVMAVSKATSPEEMFDTVVHELMHVSQHIAECYGLDPKEEMTAYLQGEVGRQLFPAVSMAVCPKCHHRYLE